MKWKMPRSSTRSKHVRPDRRLGRPPPVRASGLRAPRESV